MGVAVAVGVGVSVGVGVKVGVGVAVGVGVRVAVGVFVGVEVAVAVGVGVGVGVGVEQADTKRAAPCDQGLLSSPRMLRTTYRLRCWQIGAVSVHCCQTLIPCAAGRVATRAYCGAPW